MKHKYTFLTMIFTLFLGCIFPLRAQDFTSRGTDFWVTFGQNGLRPSGELALQIRIAGGDEATEGTISFPGLPGQERDFSIAAGEIFSYSLGSEQRGVAYNTAQGVKTAGVHITTDKPVMVYAVNSQSILGVSNMSCDATVVMPTHVLGTDYYQISYNIGEKMDAYAVIATQNGTRIYHDGIDIGQTLNTGQVYYRTSNKDMTGAHITTSKPVAFFSLSQSAFVPTGYFPGDNLFHQLMPVHTWGKKFFVPLTRLAVERIRIIASQDGTKVTREGGNIVLGSGGQNNGNNLKAGQFIEVEVQLSQSNGCYISANKPVAVCTYLTGWQYHFSHSGISGLSDPAMAWVPPLEQDIKSALLAPFANLSSYSHYALIVTPTNTKSETRVKTGNQTPQPLTTGQWYDNSFCGMSFYSMQLTNPSASYLFTNPSGIVILGYGIAAQESYYYLLSSAMRTLDLLFYVNDVHFQEVNEIICEQPVKIRAELNSTHLSTKEGYLKWYINHVEYKEARDQISWEKIFADGNYLITMEVLMDNDSIETRECSITVEAAALNQPQNLNICAGDTVSPITFTGKKINTVTWKMATGTAAGMTANNGTEFIPSFIAVNNGITPDTVRVEVTPLSPAGCTGETKIFTITVSPVSEIAPPANLIFCPGETVSPITFTGTGTTEFNWEVTEGSGREIGMSVESGSGGIPEFVVVGTVSDSLKVTVTVTPKATGDCVGESKTFTMTVYDEVSLSMDLGRDTIICRFDTLRLNATHSNALSYLWQDNTATPDYTVTKEGIYWVTLKGACKSEAHDTVKISYFEDIVVNLGKDTTFCKGDVIYIPLDVTNPYASYLWQPSGDDSPVYVIQEAGVYSVEVSNACTSVTKEITISEIDCSFDFTIPNIFTPNGDGLNELFAPEFIPLENLGEFQMYIYDRWGRLVFSTESYETLWDGNNKNGKPYTDGIYYYYLSFTHKVLKDKEYKHHGTLTLIRN